MRIDRAADEAEEKCREQITLLLQSAARFDAGNELEVVNLSARLRVLLHHNPSHGTHAALAQIGLLNQLGYADTAGDVIPENPLSHDGLTYKRLFGSGAATYVPRFNDFLTLPSGPVPLAWQIHRRVRQLPDPRPGGRGRQFDDWWNQTVIRAPHGDLFTRRGLVLAVANREGGAHIDRKLEAGFHALTRGNSLGWSYSEGSTSRPFGSPVPASIRQIAWELHLTIAEGAPYLLPAGDEFRAPPEQFPAIPQ